MKARRTRVEIVYEGVNITTSLEPYLLDFTYSDNAGKADEIQITLQDREGKWHGPWLPKEDDKIVATIHMLDWDREGDNRKLKCGTFFVDEIDFQGPPDTVKIKATSIPIPKGGKNTKRNRSWESVSLQEIASEVAASAGLTLLFDGTNPFYDRVDQVQKTDLSFLSALSQKEGNTVKVTDEQLVVYDEVKYESSPAVRVITKGKDDIKSYSFKKASANTKYKEVEISYHDEAKKKVHKYVYKVPGVGEGSTYKINERVKSLDEAIRRTQKKARELNKSSKTGKMTLVGDVDMIQGITIDTEGWQQYDDKYFIESSTHKINNGYTTDINFREVLSY